MSRKNLRFQQGDEEIDNKSECGDACEEDDGGHDKLSTSFRKTFSSPQSGERTFIRNPVDKFARLFLSYKLTGSPINFLSSSDAAEKKIVRDDGV
jgi:hypothetical protein